MVPVNPMFNKNRPPPLLPSQPLFDDAINHSVYYSLFLKKKKNSEKKRIRDFTKIYGKFATV